MCDCPKAAETLARQSASAELEIAKARAAQEETFHARLRDELASEVITFLGRALALFSPGGGVVEKSTSALEEEAKRISEPLHDFVRKRLDEIRKGAEDLRSQAFASNFVDSGLRLGRARLELKDAEDTLRRASLPVVEVGLSLKSPAHLEVWMVLEQHAQ